MLHIDIKVLMVQQITIQNMINSKLKMDHSKLKNGKTKMEHFMKDNLKVGKMKY